ncbi:hypothetical protein H4R33_004211 [Dimargaris cristalligena]|uniref:Lysozyme-like domain-containing protein n=1 Tax=Dimargaris cristalligena TaxID=215637 RepID=A0A4Q0A0F4_9FUNG|nr:hypothetical protein H4R33_004211 [Dimargaris cristalligena]RKP39477.1 lysozyme-like domain-containing protein [Dimargaris cristalligena]|eukprot:RKP39477.1 lysozyme-like domain-containing protein [Dimargaris cristalligena]
MYVSAKFFALASLLATPALVAAVPFAAPVPLAVQGDTCDGSAVIGCTADGKSVALCNQGTWYAQPCPQDTWCTALSCTWENASEANNNADTVPQQSSNAATLPTMSAADTLPVSSPVASDVVNRQDEISVSSSSSAPAASGSPSGGYDTGAAAGSPSNYGTGASTGSSGYDSGAWSPSSAIPSPSSTSSDGYGNSGSGSSDSSSGSGLMTCSEFKNAVTSNGYAEPSDALCQSIVSQFSKAGITTKLEAAMFVAQLMWESGGFVYVSEIRCAETGCAGDYQTPGVDVPGKTYFGRGYIQLTWAGNYKEASEGLYGDDRLLTNPEQVSSNQDTAVAVSMYYWKAHVHSAPGVSSGQFGAATKAINGALECGSGPNTATAQKRFAIYEKVLKALNLNDTPNSAGC